VNHQRAQGLLSAHLERDLGDAARAAVEVHAAECAVCSADLEELRDTVALLRRLPAPEPPTYLAGRVMARIRDGEANPTGWREWLGSLARPAVAAPLAALGAAAVVLAFATPEGDLRVADKPSLPMQDLALVQQQVGPGPMPSGRLVAFVVPPGPQTVGRLRGAGHPHSQLFAGHFDRPAEAVAVSWQAR